MVLRHEDDVLIQTAHGGLSLLQLSRQFRCTVQFACLAYLRLVRERAFEGSCLVRKRAFEDSWHSSAKPKGLGDPRGALAGRNRRKNVRRFLRSIAACYEVHSVMLIEHMLGPMGPSAHGSWSPDGGG